MTEQGATRKEAVRGLMAGVAAWSHPAPERAAETVRRHTGATLTRYAVGDRGATGTAWLLESDRLDAPEVYTDAGLIDFAARLDRIFS